jgi:hypothetical protein
VIVVVPKVSLHHKLSVQHWLHPQSATTS